MSTSQKQLLRALCIFTVGAFLVASVCAAQQNPKPTVKQVSAATESGAKMRLESIKWIPEKWTGPCPHEFKLEATYKSLTPGDVHFTWVRSDGATSPDAEFQFTAANEVKTVSTTWTLGSPGTSFSGWEQFEELAPYKDWSPKANFSLTCTK